MGKIAKGTSCSVAGCDESAVRSLSSEQMRGAGMSVDSRGRSYLCREHYKELKKKLRKKRELELRRYSLR